MQLLAFLKDRRLDAVIGTPTNDTDFVSRRLFAETLWACAVIDDPLLVGTGPISLDDLADKPLLSLSSGGRAANGSAEPTTILPGHGQAPGKDQ
ncbi:MAG: LysR substrate-binding domain-containing protein [Pseudomonadota bacterium]